MCRASVKMDFARRLTNLNDGMGLTLFWQAPWIDPVLSSWAHRLNALGSRTDLCSHVWILSPLKRVQNPDLAGIQRAAENGHPACTNLV